MKLAKLILHYNTPELTADLCKTIPDAIVIDNGSTVPYNGPNRCIRMPENYGFTKGWNEGIKAVFNEFEAFWLMNSDIIIDRESVRRVEWIIKTHPDVKMFTPVYNCWMNHCKPQGLKGLKPAKVIEFTAPVIRRSVFKKIGFFNEIFVRGYGVEFDFCYRMRMARLGIYVDHDSHFHHIGHQTIKKTEGLLPYSREANFELHQGLSKIYGHNWINKILNGVQIKTFFDMDLAVYVTIFGDYDTLKPWPKQNIPADFFVITDNKDLTVPEGWNKVVVDYPRKDLHPRLRAKFFKMFPWEVDELKNARLTVYVDASIEVASPAFLDVCVREMKNDMLLFRHPDRNCIYEEVKASIGLNKYLEEDFDAQMSFYRKFHPTDSGLYACGVLVRRNTELVRKIMGDWWFENIKFTWQDQLSLPVVLRANNFKPSLFSFHQYRNEYFHVKWHDDKSHKTEGEPQQPQSPKNELSQKLSATVLMPVKDTPVDYFKLAYQSISEQVKRLCEAGRDVKILVVNDGSKEENLLAELDRIVHADPFTKMHTIDNPKGLANALDTGLLMIDTDLVVRMDSDDIARPDLIEKQMDYFGEHPECHIRGVCIELFTAKKRWHSKHDREVTPESEIVKKDSFWIMNHPGVCYRLKTVLDVGGYGDTPPQFAEDYVLWAKLMAAGYTLYNTDEVLLEYRAGNGSQIGQNRKSAEWLQFLQDTRKKYLSI